MTTTAHYVGAIPVESVVCPAWCTISQEERLHGLPDWQGRVIHWSAEASGDNWSVRHADMTYSNGEPDPTNSPDLFITCTSEGVPAYAALRLAEAIRKAALEALEVQR